MDKDMLQLIRDVNGTNQFYCKEFYSLEIAFLLDDFTDCEFTDFMKNVYREGRVYEILSLQMQQFMDDLRSPKERKIIRKAMVEKIEKANAIIRQDLANNPTVVNLAKEVGMNQTILQKGFRRMHKMTVNEYVRKPRLKKAKELLEESDLNITEICERIGMNSCNYFSKLFRKKHGLSPKTYQRTYKSASADISEG